MNTKTLVISIIASTCLLLVAGIAAFLFFNGDETIHIRGIPKDWSCLSGDISQWDSDGNAIYGHTDKGDSILASARQYSDVTFSAMVSTTNREASLALRMQDPDNGYLVIFGPDGTSTASWNGGHVWLIKRKAGEEQQLATFNRGGLSAPGQFEKLTVIAKGPRFEVRLNDVTIIKTSDRTFTNGYIGLRIYGDPNYPCDGVFSNLTIRARRSSLFGEAETSRQPQTDADSQSVTSQAVTAPEIETNVEQPSTSTPAARPVELKIKWPPVGQRIVLETDTERNGEYLNPGQPAVEEKQSRGKKYGLTVLQETPDGGHEVELEFLGIRDRTVLGGKTVLDYDSTKPLAEKPIPLTDLYGKVVGSKVRFFLNASNDVERTDGMDELQKRLSSGALADTNTFSRAPFSEGYLVEMMNGLHSWMPSKAVQPGDSWSFHREITLDPYGTMNVDYTVSFQGWEEHEKRNCARLEFQGTIKAKPDSNPADTSVTGFAGNISAVAWFDPQLGLGIEIVKKSDMKLVLNAPAKPGENLGTSGSTQSTTYQWSEVETTNLEM